MLAAAPEGSVIWNTSIGCLVAETPCDPPGAGDWVITQDCTLKQDATVAANVILDGSVTLTIAANVTLNIDFLNFHVKVKNTGKLVIKNGAKVD